MSEPSIRIIEVSIGKRDGGLLSLETNAGKYLSTQYDNGRQKLRFSRLSEFLDDDLILFFEDEKNQYEPFVVEDNEFLIPNTLTQYEILHMQVAFSRGGEIISHSNFLTFSLRKSLLGGLSPIIPWPNPITTLLREAFTAIRYDGRKLLVENLGGETVAELDIAGAGAGGTGLGLYAFSVSENGDLILQYDDGADPPNFRIDENGDLIWAT